MQSLTEHKKYQAITEVFSLGAMQSVDTNAVNLCCSERKDGIISRRFSWLWCRLTDVVWHSLIEKGLASF